MDLSGSETLAGLALNSLTKLTNNPFGEKVETLNNHLQVLVRILVLNVGILHFHKKKLSR